MGLYIIDYDLKD